MAQGWAETTWIITNYGMFINQFPPNIIKLTWLLEKINGKYVDNGQLVRVFANGPGDQGSIPSRVIPKTQKMVLDATLLNTQHFKGID